MDADWYEDPLGRFDGRFFDGENWTARVSSAGVLETDPNFPSASDELVDDPTPAVSPIASSTRQNPPASAESSVRVVAVLDEAVVVNRTPAISKSTMDALSEKALKNDRKKRRVSLIMLATLIALGLGIFAVDRLTRSHEVAPLDQAQTDRVEDLEAGSGDSASENSASGDVALDDLDLDELEVDSPAAVPEPDDEFDPSEMLEIGSLSIVNGTSVLADLADWHQGFAADQDVVLGADAGCWFGQLGGAVLQVVHCGPVAGSVDSEYFFDQVPVDFIDVENGQLAQPIVDAVMANTVISNAVTLIGSIDGPAPPEGLTRTRGDRSAN